MNPPLLRSLAVTAGLVAIVPFAYTQVLINWGGNYVDTSTSSFLSNSDNTNQLITTGGNISPTSGNYRTTDGGTIAGPGFVAGVSVTGGSWNAASIYNGTYSSQDFIDYRMTVATAARTMIGVVLFNGADFANSWNSSNQAFNFTVRGRVNNTSTAITSNEVRLVLQSGSNYYLSDQTVSLPKTANSISNAATYSSVLGSPLSVEGVTWRNYDPSTSISGSIGSIVSPTFSSVDRIGFYFKVTTDNSASTNVQYQIYEFSAEAVPVPEPSAYAMLAGLATLSWGIFRRRRA